MNFSFKCSARAGLFILWAIASLIFVLGYVAGCTKAYAPSSPIESERGATPHVSPQGRSVTRSGCGARDGVGLSLPAKEFAGFGLVAKTAGGLGAAGGKFISTKTRMIGGGPKNTRRAAMAVSAARRSPEVTRV